MDRSLDEIIDERPRGRETREPKRPPPPSAPRAPRREEYPRDGVRKTRHDDRTDLDSDWVHDRYDDDRDRNRNRLNQRAPVDTDRLDRPPRREDRDGTRLRVDNIHYELTETDLRELFERIGPVQSVRLLYDRMDRSQGTAFVTYHDIRDAKDAIVEFNGCNANGQPIKLSLMPTAPAAAPSGNMFDRVERPAGRSLFDRIEAPRDDSREFPIGRRRNRSESPRRRPTPDNVDRYVPGRRSRSPIKRRGTPREPGRRPGHRREEIRGGRRPRADEGRPLVGGRPRKTAEELDAEMADYWGSKGAEASNGVALAQNGTTAAAATSSAAQPVDDDIDMVE